MNKAIAIIAFAAVANCALLDQQQQHHHHQHGFYQELSFQPFTAPQPFPQQGLVARSSQPQSQYHVNSAQAGPDATAQVLRADAAVNPDSFQYAYETSNGIQGQEQGQLKRVGAESAIVAQGQFGWTSPEGTPVQIQYTADENGYQPTGSILPVAPETPAHVLRLVEYLRTHAPQQQTETFSAPQRTQTFGGRQTFGAQTFGAQAFGGRQTFGAQTFGAQAFGGRQTFGAQTFGA